MSKNSRFVLERYRW